VTGFNLIPKTFHAFHIVLAQKQSHLAIIAHIRYFNGTGGKLRMMLYLTMKFVLKELFQINNFQCVIHTVTTLQQSVSLRSQSSQINPGVERNSILRS